MAEGLVLTDDSAARIVAIGERCRRISYVDGCIVMSGEEGEPDRVPIREIAGMVAPGPGLSWSGPALTVLTERSAGVVLCSANHASSTMTWPVAGRRWPRRIRALLGIDPLFGRQLLRQLEVARRRQRISVLEAMGKGGALASQAKAQRPVRGLARPRRKTADAEPGPGRHYWPWLVGPGFRRNPRKPGANGVVNCGHTQLRIAATRAVHAAGLHPSIGLRGRTGSQGLVDELMMPFRPVVDLAAAIYIATGRDKVDAIVQNAFERLMVAPLRGRRGTFQIALALAELARSLGECLESGNARLDLELPARQNPEMLFALLDGQAGGETMSAWG